VTDRVKEAGAHTVTQIQAIDTKYQLSQRATAAVVQGAIVGAREVSKVCNNTAGPSTGSTTSTRNAPPHK
jgi:hypothetical protein